MPVIEKQADLLRKSLLPDKLPGVIQICHRNDILKFPNELTCAKKKIIIIL